MSMSSVTGVSPILASAATRIWPLRSKLRETAPRVAKSDPLRLKMCPTSAAARFLLSVRTFTMMPTPPAA